MCFYNTYDFHFYWYLCRYQLPTIFLGMHGWGKFYWNLIFIRTWFIFFQLQNPHSVLVHFQKQDPDSFQLRSDPLQVSDRMVLQLLKWPLGQKYHRYRTVFAGISIEVFSSLAGAPVFSHLASVAITVVPLVPVSFGYVTALTGPWEENH